MQAVILKKNREKVLLNRHHWIFSGAVHSFPEHYKDGDLTPIKSIDQRLLGWGFFNRKCSLTGRVISFGEEDGYTAIKNGLSRALDLRKNFLQGEITACRLVNGEGDGLPGLIIDKYGPYLVVQTGALGMRTLLPFVCEWLKENLPLKGIYDKSISSSLKEEGMASREEIIWGEVPDEVTISEEGNFFKVALKKGQKTGFFLDQREMRTVISRLSRGKRVLNGFCYTGGFTVAALKGGATQVESVDISSDALALCKENVQLNGFALDNHRFYQEDMFEFLNRNLCDFDLVILDPPAFAKKKKDIPNALKGYRKLFEMALHKMPNRSILMLSSCSYYISETLFENCVYKAALSANRSVRIMGYHRHALDHPINLLHPESHYLKSLILGV